MKKIILTGGGTAGHVTPNLALIPALLDDGWEIHYAGTSNGIENSIIPKNTVTYHTVSSGKFRRYFDMENFTDPFKIIAGIIQSTVLVNKLKPCIIFSKGGFVSVPVIIGAWMNNVPVIIHESDVSPGLANRLSSPFATRICVTFPETMEHVPEGKVELAGTPVRKEILGGSKRKGYELCGFTGEKPVILVTGGSQGSARLNGVIRSLLPGLLGKFHVAHICGKGNMDDGLKNLNGYKQFEYVSEEQPHIFAITSMAVSRAGANSIFEFLYLGIPNILIPLGTGASRGDQILNARSFERQGFSIVLDDNELNGGLLYKKILELHENRDIYVLNMKETAILDAVAIIMSLIKKYAKIK